MVRGLQRVDQKLRIHTRREAALMLYVPGIALRPRLRLRPGSPRMSDLEDLRVRPNPPTPTCRIVWPHAAIRSVGVFDASLVRLTRRVSDDLDRADTSDDRGEHFDDGACLCPIHQQSPFASSRCVVAGRVSEERPFLTSGPSSTT